MLNTKEKALLEKVREASIEFKLEAYQVLGADLKSIQEQLALILGQPIAPQTEVKPVTPIVPVTQEQEEIKESKKENHKVSNVNKLTGCGPDKGDDEVLFIEKRKDSKHLWFGQIRMNNIIRNFHWSNELELPIVYGIESKDSLVKASNLIRTTIGKISPKELTMYDSLMDHEYTGGFKARQYYEELSKGSYIYATPQVSVIDGEIAYKEDEIIFKGYINNHAFIINSAGDVFWRNYNFIFSKKPFERTVSKGYDQSQMEDEIEDMASKVELQLLKASSGNTVKSTKKNKNIKKDLPDEILNDSQTMSLL